MTDSANRGRERDLAKGWTALALLLAVEVGVALAGRVEDVHDVQLPPGQGALGFGRSVAAAGGRVVIGAHDGPIDGFACGNAAIFDVATGDMVRSLRDVMWPPPAACVDGFGFGVVVAAGGGRAAVAAPASRAVHLFSLDGEFERTLRHPYDGIPELELTAEGFGSAVALDAGTVLVGGARDGVYAFDSSTGALKWQRALDGDAVAVGGARVFVGIPALGTVAALDAATGENLWSVGGPPPFDPFPLAFGAAIAADHDGVLVGGWRNVRGRAVVVLLDAATGRVVEKYRGPRPHRLVPAWELFGFALALGKDLVIVGDPGSSEEWGAAYVFSRRRGRRIARFRPPTENWQQAGTAVAEWENHVVVGSPHTSDAHVFSVRQE